MGVDVKNIDTSIRQVKYEMVLRWWKGAETGVAVGFVVGVVAAVLVEELVVHKK